MSNTIQSVDTIYVGYSPTQLSDLSKNTTVTTANCDADKILNSELNYQDGVLFFFERPCTDTIAKFFGII